jgi:hypothetical protein
MLGWRVTPVLKGFPTLAGFSIELRCACILLELIESSDGRAGETSFSSGTGVGGLLNTRPFFAFREDSMGVEYCGARSSSLCSASESSSEDGPSKPANKLLVLKGLLMALSLSRPRGPLSLLPGYRFSTLLFDTFSSSAMRSWRADGAAIGFSDALETG